MGGRAEERAREELGETGMGVTRERKPEGTGTVWHRSGNRKRRGTMGEAGHGPRLPDNRINKDLASELVPWMSFFRKQNLISNYR